jgi:hypothetical protein
MSAHFTFLYVCTHLKLKVPRKGLTPVPVMSVQTFFIFYDKDSTLLIAAFAGRWSRRE